MLWIPKQQHRFTLTSLFAFSNNEKSGSYLQYIYLFMPYKYTQKVFKQLLINSPVSRADFTSQGTVFAYDYFYFQPYNIHSKCFSKLLRQVLFFSIPFSVIMLLIYSTVRFICFSLCIPFFICSPPPHSWFLVDLMYVCICVHACITVALRAKAIQKSCAQRSSPPLLLLPCSHSSFFLPLFPNLQVTNPCSFWFTLPMFLLQK